MKVITDRTLSVEQTHGGWVGELESLALSSAQRAELAALAGIKESQRQRFYDCVDSINSDFRQDAMARIAFKKRFGAEKLTKTLRDSKEEIAQVARALGDELEMLGEDLFCELADDHLDPLHLHTFYNQLLKDLASLEVICARATVEVRRGRDNSILQQYLMRWAHLYEDATGKTVGMSKSKEGDSEGPFVNAVRRFFEFQPHELCNELGINTQMLTKAIRNAIADHKAPKSQTRPILKKNG
jgi:hypothetical protein